MLASSERIKALRLQGYSTLRAARVIGVTARQLQNWDETGLVHPRIPGRDRIWTHQDLTALLVIKELRQKGITLRQIRGMFARPHLQAQLARFHLSSTKEPTYLLTDGFESNLVSPFGAVNIMLVSERLMALVELRRFPAF